MGLSELSCNLCDNKYTSKRSLAVHLTRSHRQRSSTTRILTKRQKEYQRHLQTIRKVELDIQLGLLFQCPRCDIVEEQLINGVCKYCRAEIQGQRLHLDIPKKQVRTMETEMPVNGSGTMKYRNRSYLIS